MPAVFQTTPAMVVQQKKDSVTIERVNNYKMEKLLGTGSYGSVYRACDDEGGLVAIKVLDKSFVKRKPQV